MDYILALETFTQLKAKIINVKNQQWVNYDVNGHIHLFENANSLITNFYTGDLTKEGLTFKANVKNASSRAENEAYKLTQLEYVIENIINDINVKEIIDTQKDKSDDTNETSQLFENTKSELSRQNKKSNENNITGDKSKHLSYFKISIFVFLTYIIITSYKLFNIPFNIGVYISIQLALIIILVVTLIKKYSERTTFLLNFLAGLFLVILGVVLTRYL